MDGHGVVYWLAGCHWWSAHLWVGWPASTQAVLLPRWPQTYNVARATAFQSTQEPSQHLRKQSAVMTVKAATTLWPFGAYV